MTQRHVLVTGGAGYIGSHACKALAASGFVPVAYDNLVHGHRSAVKWGPFVQGDVSNGLLLADVISRYDIQAVMHFAAFAYVGESMHAPGKYFLNNVSNSITLLEVMRAQDVRSIVFSSTCATYGQPEALPIDETHPQCPVNPYGESKLAVERALYWYQQAYDLRSVALRYFNAAGADPAGEIGEDHDPETHLIPLVIETAMGRRAAIDVYGNDYPTPDGTAVRDYIHVADLADAHVRALRHLLDGGDSLRLNLGTGHGHSVREVVDAVERFAARPVAVRECPRRPGDPPELVAGAERAREVLGWQPRHSDLRMIIETAWRWHEQLVSARKDAKTAVGT